MQSKIKNKLESSIMRNVERHFILQFFNYLMIFWYVEDGRCMMENRRYEKADGRREARL